MFILFWKGPDIKQNNRMTILLRPEILKLIKKKYITSENFEQELKKHEESVGQQNFESEGDSENKIKGLTVEDKFDIEKAKLYYEINEVNQKLSLPDNNNNDENNKKKDSEKIHDLLKVKYLMKLKDSQLFSKGKWDDHTGKDMTFQIINNLSYRSQKIFKGDYVSSKKLIGKLLLICRNSAFDYSFDETDNEAIEALLANLSTKMKSNYNNLKHLIQLFQNKNIGQLFFNIT